MSILTHLARPARKANGLFFPCLLACYFQAAPVLAQDGFEPFKINSFGDARLRYHTIDQDAFEQSAQALSLRIKLGLELNIFENSTALIEFEGSENFIEDFNDGLNGEIGRPVILSLIHI